MIKRGRGTSESSPQQPALSILAARSSLLPRGQYEIVTHRGGLVSTRRNFWEAHAVDGYRARFETRAGLAGARSLGLHALARDRPPYVEVVPVCVQKWRPVVVRARSGRLLWWLGNLGYAQACRSCIAQSLKRSRAVVSRPPVLNGRRCNERHCWLTAVSSASLRASLEWKYGPKRTWYASAGQVSGCQSWLRK